MSPESLMPATPQSVTPKKGEGTATQTAGNGQPTMTGLYAQTLKNGRKSSSSTEEESSAQATDGASSVTTDEPSSSANAGLETAALRTYTATGALSKPPSVAGEVFQTTV